MKKNTAVIGYGEMGGWHVPHILKSDVVSLAGVYDTDRERVLRAKEKNIKTYDSFEAVLDDDSVELVVIAVPNQLHEDMTVRALKAGKHVICEKPVTTSSQSLENMIAAANESGKLFTVHQNRRWDRDYLCMKQIIETGEIGDVFRIESRYHGSRGIPGDWRQEKECGGGMLFDWGVHLIDQMLLLISSEIDNVRCTFTHITNVNVDDGFHLEIKFKDGKEGAVEVMTYNFIELPRFYMTAEQGSALIHTRKTPANIVKCTSWTDDYIMPVVTPTGTTRTMSPRDDMTTDSYEIPLVEKDVHDFYRNVCSAIDGREEQLVTHEQIRKVLRVIELAFESDSKKGAPIQF